MNALPHSILVRWRRWKLAEGGGGFAALELRNWFDELQSEDLDAEWPETSQMEEAMGKQSELGVDIHGRVQEAADEPVGVQNGQEHAETRP